MKILLLLLSFATPALCDDGVVQVTESTGGQEQWETTESGESDENWLDSSHSYATEQAQVLSEWMDSFFGTPNYEVELPESLLRIGFSNDWDEQDGMSTNVGLRGKIQLPALSKRLNLVFSDDSGDDPDIDTITGDDRNRDNGVGLQYEVSESKRSRVDLTLGLNWNRIRPGVRYRHQDALGKFSSYRLTQRLQYDNNDGLFSTSQVELNRKLSDSTILRWINRGKYGEETKGAEWLTRLSLFQRHKRVNRRHVLGVNYYAAINGNTDPKYVKNYRIGTLFRRQIYRKYLFMEVEPAYNYRKKKPGESREFAWSIALRLEIALERDLARKSRKKKSRAAADTQGEPDGEFDPTGSAYQPEGDTYPVGGN